MTHDQKPVRERRPRPRRSRDRRQAPGLTSHDVVGRLRRSPERARWATRARSTPWPRASSSSGSGARPSS
ncbi:hypothetical protein NKG05_01070 [Oerskovia sp. M15]